MSEDESSKKAIDELIVKIQIPKPGRTMAGWIHENARKMHEERMKLPLCERLGMHSNPKIFRNSCGMCGLDWLKENVEK